MNQDGCTCVLIRSDETYEGKQGLTYSVGIFAGNTGAQAICLHALTIPPGGRARAHTHAGHETAIYVISGEAGMWYGEGLREHMTVSAGDYLYIPAGVAHLPYNPSQTEPCVAVLARTDPNEQESVVLLEEAPHE
jgi:uncharacterized RmlC-like cupin family protein